GAALAVGAWLVTIVLRPPTTRSSTSRTPTPAVDRSAASAGSPSDAPAMDQDEAPTVDQSEPLAVDRSGRPTAGRGTGPAAAGGSRPPSLRSILRTPGLIGAIVVSTSILLAIDLLITYLPALGEERGWPASLVGGL